MRQIPAAASGFARAPNAVWTAPFVLRVAVLRISDGVCWSAVLPTEFNSTFRFFGGGWGKSTTAGMDEAQCNVKTPRHQR